MAHMDLTHVPASTSPNCATFFYNQLVRSSTKGQFLSGSLAYLILMHVVMMATHL